MAVLTPGLSTADRALFARHAGRIASAQSLKQLGIRDDREARRQGYVAVRGPRRGKPALYLALAELDRVRTELASVAGCEIFALPPARRARWQADGLEVAVLDEGTALQRRVAAELVVDGRRVDFGFTRTLEHPARVLGPGWHLDPDLPARLTDRPSAQEQAQIDALGWEIGARLERAGAAIDDLVAALEAIDVATDQPLHRALGGFRQKAGENLAQQAHRLERDRVARAFSVDLYAGEYRAARALRRRFVLHVGPTNSGKTHAAFDALERAGEGLYLGPLRLLALEARDALVRRGLKVDLATGEERECMPGARFRASTVEMGPPAHEIACAVIDEAQMVADAERGWAWTAALVGMPAREIHVTGSPDLVPVIERLAAHTGDGVEVRSYARKTPLVVDRQPVRTRDLLPGDAVIAFSRREVLAWRDHLSERGWSVAVVYGALGPEVRRGEAERFRTSDARILVATDAIGMGLNLPIRRVVFARMTKFDGRSERPLLDAEIRQIAGRAGRYGYAEQGRVAAMDGHDARRLGAALVEAPGSPPERAPVAPAPMHIHKLARMLDSNELARLLSAFDRLARPDHPLFAMTALGNQIALAALADRTSLPLGDKIVYARAPIDATREDADLLAGWMQAHAEREIVPLPADLPLGRGAGVDARDLAEAERAIRLLSLYAWLHHHWPETYPERSDAGARQRAWTRYMSEAFTGGRPTLTPRGQEA